MSNTKNPNMTLWDEVCTTDPSMTKAANVRGNKITAIAPQSQIKQATEQFGPYGGKWGFKTVNIDYTLMEKGLVTFKGEFYYPGGEFEIISSISIYKDNAHSKTDDDFAKKVETDALTKALSKIGFNADIFLGKYDDSKYVTELWEEKKKEELPPWPEGWGITRVKEELREFYREMHACSDVDQLDAYKASQGDLIEVLRSHYPIGLNGDGGDIQGLAQDYRNIKEKLESGEQT